MLAKHPKEFLIFNNKPAWGVIIDNRDQEILYGVRYEKAQRAGFHHVYYIPERYLEKISLGEVTFVWGDERGVSSFEVVPSVIAEKAKEIYALS